MPEAPYAPLIPPMPPRPTRVRSQLESFLVLRRNPIELWGGPAYTEDILPGRFLGRRQMMLNAPEAIKHVLLTNAENYRRNHTSRRVLQPILGAGLFLAEGDDWRHQRRTIAPALAPRTMPLLARHVMNATEEAGAKLAALTNRPLELLPHLQNLALTIAGQSMFSLQMEGFGTELRALLTRYALECAPVSFLDLVLPANRASFADRTRAKFRAEWLSFLDRLMQARTPSPDAPRDLFDLLSEAHDPETGAVFDAAQLRDEVSTLILAGHETTAVTLFWSIYLATLYPAYQAELAEEAASVDLTTDPAAALARLPKIRAHLDEALRLYPPAFMLVREAQQDDEILGLKVPAGTVLTICPWVIHRHAKRWRNPDGFDPTRFASGAPPPDRYAYLPFGAGPRICVGAQFALTEAVVVLASLLRRFTISFAGRGTVFPRGLVTTQPDRPVPFILTAR